MSISTTLGPKPDLPPQYTQRQMRNTMAWVLSILVVVMVMVAATATVLAIAEHGKVTDAEASLAQAKDDLKQSELDLATAQDLQSDAEDTVSEQNGRLDACADVVTISNYQMEQTLLLSGAVSDAIGNDFTGGSDKLDEVQTYVDKSELVLSQSGYADLTELWAACMPSGSL